MAAKAKKGKDSKLERQVDINLSVYGIGNMGCDRGRFVFDATFMNAPLQREKLLIYRPCACGSTDNYYFSWTLTVKIKEENDIVDISSNPIIITCYKLNIDEEQEDPQEIKDNMLMMHSIAIVDLIDIVTKNAENISKTIVFQYPKIKKGANIRTTPNMPYLKCNLTTTLPILCDPDSTFNKFFLTVECAINIHEKFLTDEYTYESGFVIPLDAQNEAILKCGNGYLTTENDLPHKKIIWNLSHLEHHAKYAECATKRSYAKDQITYPDSNVNLQDPLLTDKSELIAMYCQHECILSHKTLQSFIETKNCLSIEFLAKPKVSTAPLPPVKGKKDEPEEPPNHMVGYLSLNTLRYVGSTEHRVLIPLQKYDTEEYLKKCGRISSALITPTKSTSKFKGKDKKPANKSTEVVQGLEEDEELTEIPDYIKNDEGYVSCIAVEAQVGVPLVPKRFEDFTIHDMRKIQTMEAFETKDRSTLNELHFLFNQEIKNYAQQAMEQDSDPTKKLMVSEGNLLGAVTTLLSKKFNFTEGVDEDSIQNLLENSYIYIINQIHNIIRQNSCNYENVEKNIHDFKLQCAGECYQLGMFEEVTDFLIMNIRDKRDSEQYVTYAKCCLYNGNLQTCLACCEDALKLDPNCSICYLLQAYVAFVYKDYKTAEKILKCTALKNDQFVELWLGLFVIHYQTENKAQMCIDLRNAILASNSTWDNPFYKQHFVISWIPKKYADPILYGVIHFIKWGLWEFAEILLVWLMHEYGCDSFEYQYHMALIDFYRKNYTMVLQRLVNIKKCISKHELSEMLMLKAGALLKLESLRAISVIREYWRLTSDKGFDKRASLLFLHTGYLYLKLRKYRTASFYFKQCVHDYRTFASYICLGKAELHIGNLDNAETCFKMAYQINPYNSITWGNLAIIYFRKGLTLQCQLALENTKKQTHLDQKLADDLKKIEEYLETSS